MRVSYRRRKFHSARAVGPSVVESHNLRRRSSIALLVLDQLCAGVIVSDDGGRVIEMNRAAESIVRLDDGLNLKNGRLCARRAFETGKIAKLIIGATANTKSDWSAGRMPVGRGDGCLPMY